MIDVVKNTLYELYGDDYHLITVAISGSHAYGMAHKDSDYDLIGLFLPPVSYIIGMDKVEQITIPKTVLNKQMIEGTIFDFRKWFKLMFQQNPNVLELLWHHETMYIYRDQFIWPMLMAKRNELLSTKAKHSFAGYAHAQFQRLEKLNEKVNQNEERLADFNKYGYSTKNAAHLYRLLGMCMDILMDHELQVMRPERQQLLAIRSGQYSLKEIRFLVDQKFDRIEDAYIHTTLRKKIDYDMANQLHIDILTKYLESKEITWRRTLSSVLNVVVNLIHRLRMKLHRR